jgi:hypothetical protein
MKKQLKKIISLVLVLSMVLAISISGFAAESAARPIIGLGITKEHTHISSASVNPRFVIVCNGKPYHDMVSRGVGAAYIRLSNGSLETYISYGACWQCKACNMVMITEHDIYPDAPSPIGKYAVWGHYEPINVTGTDIVTLRNQTNKTNNSSISGYQFRYGDL